MPEWEIKCKVATVAQRSCCKGSQKLNPTSHHSAWQPTPVFSPGEWTVEPGGLQSIGSQRVGHDWSHLACMHALWTRKIHELPWVPAAKTREPDWCFPLQIPFLYIMQILDLHPLSFWGQTSPCCDKNQENKAELATHQKIAREHTRSHFLPIRLGKKSCWECGEFSCTAERL